MVGIRVAAPSLSFGRFELTAPTRGGQAISPKIGACRGKKIHLASAENGWSLGLFSLILTARDTYFDVLLQRPVTNKSFKD